ncbi:MAG: Rrf2 family transcriptional regulator [Planctomycetes bacterium]|nr:Rrf2 family transcriptional regulator [Planctomycetota bacterium]
MRLSLQTDFALRTLMYLGSVGERATIEEVADYYHISLDHVAKVVSQLVRLGWVRGIRGAGGGIELGKPAVDISVGAVVAAFEGDVHLLECLGRDGVCIIESFCKLKKVLARAEDLQRDYLAGVSLQDVLPSRAKLKT